MREQSGMGQPSSVSRPTHPPSGMRRSSPPHTALILRRLPTAAGSREYRQRTRGPLYLLGARSADRVMARLALKQQRVGFRPPAAPGAVRTEGPNTTKPGGADPPPRLDGILTPGALPASRSPVSA